MEQEKLLDPTLISYNDTAYKLDELERIFDKKVYQRIIKKKNEEWTNLYLFLLAAIKCFKNSSKNSHASVQEIVYSLEKLEKNWSFFHKSNKVRFCQLVRYHVLKTCDIDIPTPRVSYHPIRLPWKKNNAHA